MTNNRNPQKIAYLVKTFPKVTETFILQEILALEKHGLHLTLFSLHLPTDSQIHPLVARLQATVFYLPSIFTESTMHDSNTYSHLLEFAPKQFKHALDFFLHRQEGGEILEFYQAAFLAATLKRLGIKHIHAHFASEPTGMAELVNRFTGIPYSFTAHAKDIYLSDPEALNRKMQGAKFVITCTEYNRKFLQGISTADTPIYRAYHGLDVKRFQVPFMSNARSEEIPIVLSVGRFREKKGFLTLIQACKLLKEFDYRFHCQIVGYGPLQQTIEQRIHALQLDGSVSLLGKRAHDEVVSLYQKTAVFVLPCQIADDGDRDGIPNVLLEAMAMQIPVISTKVSGIPELVENMKDGILVPPKDPHSLARAIGYLLDQPIFRQTLARAGRKKVMTHFSEDRHIPLVYKLFTEEELCTS